MTGRASRVGPCVALAVGLAVPVAGFADNPVDARREDKAEHLLTEHVETWVEEIAGFNRRNALCDADAAKAAAAYDVTHHATFKRTLGWRLDTASGRWLPTAPKQAEVTLVYSGPVRSGTVMIAGKAVSFCRAEAPDKIETWAVHEPDAKGSVSSFGSSYPLPTLAPGLDAVAGAAPPQGVPASTPRAEIDARLAKAAAMLAQEQSGADALLADSRKKGACSQEKAAETAKKFVGLSMTKTRTDGPVHVDLRGSAYSGPLKDGEQMTWVCYALQPPLTITATAAFEAEGDNELSFALAP